MKKNIKTFIKNNKIKLDIKKSKQLNNFCINNNIDIIIHMAAQAGIRYSLKNPRDYLENNVGGLFNLMEVARKNKITVIDDNCESLGSIYKKKYLGTYGDFSSFSFYFSHQVTSGEGGMIVCKSKKDYNILKALRAHGWDRDFNKKNILT